MTTTELTTALVGYEARQEDGRTVVGEVEGVHARGVRVHKIPGYPGRHGYIPAEAIERIDRALDVLVLRPGITGEGVANAPAPPDDSPGGWHVSTDWWADLLGHFGLFDPEGRGDGPYLHAGRSRSK